MKKQLALLLLALAFAVPAFAQQSVVSCNEQGIGGVEYSVCDVNGKVHVVYNEPPQYWSAWFTHAQFSAWKAKLNSKHTNRKSEAEAQSWHTQDNNGARIGEIKNLAVEFVADDGTKWTFLPYKILDDLPASTENRDVARLWMKGRDFSPILIPGKQTGQHTFLFLADEFENLAPHNFHVRLFMWLAGEKAPSEQQLSTLDFNPAVVSTLMTGSMQTVPFEEEKELVNGLK